MKVFFTGYPGFIGARVIAALATRHPDAEFVLLVQPRFEAAARTRLQAQGLTERARVVLGDLTREGLGVPDDALSGVTHAWHLAAIYDLSVPEPLAIAVNVQGTKNLLDVLENVPTFERLVYFSTCYVAGQQTGRILETDLATPQGFNNFYESTKHAAEQEVRSRLARIPTVIIRPAVVVGDSATGETDKYDGPYYIMRTLMRSPKWLRLMVGPGTARMNIVPVDFIVAASVELAADPHTAGLTFQLADPDPLPLNELATVMNQALGRGPPMINLPLGLVKASLAWPSTQRLLGIPAATAAYLHYEVEFDTTNTRTHLHGKVVCPRMHDYMQVLVNYVRQNPKKEFMDGRAI